jgi:hypothetical protein
MKISPISVAGKCHIWKVHGKAVAVAAIIKIEKQL